MQHKVARCGPFRAIAARTCRRAFRRDQPVAATSSSSIRPRPFLDAVAYSRAYFFVISRLVAIDSSEPIPPAHRSAPTMTSVSRAKSR